VCACVYVCASRRCRFSEQLDVENDQTNRSQNASPQNPGTGQRDVNRDGEVVQVAANGVESEQVPLVSWLSDPPEPNARSNTGAGQPSMTSQPNSPADSNVTSDVDQSTSSSLSTAPLLPSAPPVVELDDGTTQEGCQ